MDTSFPASALKTRKRKVVLLPIGSCEQHGSYLPIDTDLRIAQLLAEQLSHMFSPDNVLLLPALPFSCSWEHKGLGTLAINVSTLASVIHDLAHSLNTWNISVLLILVNWHGGNDLLGTVATEITAREGIPCAAIPTITQVGKAWDDSSITSANDIHAGAVETSIVQAYWPDMVPLSPPPSAHDEPMIKPAKEQSVLQTLGSYTITRDGIWGAPEDANAEKGRALIEHLIQDMHKQISQVLDLVHHHYGRE